ncbi:MAG: carboxypeptidase regulatory-like domain-containing protein [Candidatus Scalinduaceae bacterium]
MVKVETAKNVLRIIVTTLIISVSFYITKFGLCSEEFNRNAEHFGGKETPISPPDDYAKKEARIIKMGEELTYKNMMVAKEAQGLVENPGIIVGKITVTNAYSGISERHSANIIIYIENMNGNNYKPVQKRHVKLTEHIAFTKEKGIPSEPPIMDQWNVEFIPHILPVLKGSIVDFPNTDTVRHNVYSPVPLPGTKRILSLGTYNPEVIKTVRLNKSGEIPLRCNVHQEMSAVIVVLDNPYFTLTNKKGEFMIDNVPPGKYTLKTWHEKYKPVSMKVTVEPNQTIEVELPTISEKRDAR